LPLSGETQSCRFASPIGTKLGYRQNFCNKQPYATFLFRSAAQADIAACLGNGTSSSDCGSPSGTGFGYDGYRYDPETGLYHTGARYYDPRLGRFLQPDPIGQAGGVNLYAYVNNDPLNGVDPLGLWTLQVGGSAYFNFGWFSFQLSAGIAADGHGNAGYYVNGNAGPAVGGGFKFAGNGAVSTAPTINDLNGPGAGVSVTAGVGAAGSLDWSKGIANNGQTYNSYGGSLGLGAGGGVSAGPSRTGVWCQVGPDCGSSSTPSQGNGIASTASSPTPLIGQTDLASAAQGGAAPGSTGSGGQSSATK